MEANKRVQEPSAAEVLASKREANRLAQKRFRQRIKEAKKIAAEEALARHQEKLLELASSDAGPSSSSVMAPSSQAQAQAQVWQPSPLNPAPALGQAHLDASSGIPQPQDKLIAAMYGRGTLQQHQLRAVNMSVPYSEDQRQAASRLLGQGTDASKWGLRDAATSAAAVSTPWTSERPPPRPPLPPQRRIHAAPHAAPVSYDGLYSKPSSKSSSISNSSAFSIVSSLLPEAPIPIAWRNLLEQDLGPVGCPVAIAHQQQQQQQQQLAKVAPSSLIAVVSSTESSLSAAMPARGAVASVSVGQTSATGTSVGSGTQGDSSSSSPESIETIGSHVPTNARSIAERLMKYDYADVVQANKAWRLSRSANINGVEGSAMSMPEGAPILLLTESAREVYDNMALQMLYYSKMTLQELKEHTEPRVVRTGDFAMLHSTFGQAFSKIAMKAKQPKIDVLLLSDIAASWSLNEASESNKATGDSNPSTDTSLDREWHTQRWRDIPKNLWPTQAQLEIAHRPWLDFGVVWPDTRDRILKLLQVGAIDEDELHADLFLGGIYVDGEPFRIWGTDPSDPMAWEVCEEFAQKWHFLFNEEIINRTNWWRKQRKLEPLQIHTTSSFVTSNGSLQPLGSI